MPRSLEFLLGLLDAAYPAHVAWEDFTGPHGDALRSWQRLGFLATGAGTNPVPSCPHCFAGTPYRIGDDYVCNRCRSDVDARELQLWRFDLAALLRFLASSLSLTGGVERIDDELWQLGTLRDPDRAAPCFFLRGEICSEYALRRLSSFRSALLFHGQPVRPTVPGFEGSILSLHEVLSLDGERLTVLPLFPARPRGGPVRFDPGAGTISAGEVELGRIPLGTREFWFLECLAAHAGQFVAYSDLKHYVGRKSGSRADADEATFCQKLRSRIKLRHGVRHIDDLIRSDRKGGGYALRPTFDAGA